MFVHHFSSPIPAGIFAEGREMMLKSFPWGRTVGFLCITVILGFLGRELWGNWNALQSYFWKVNPSLALFSFAALTGSLFCLPWGLREILALLGFRLPYWRVSRILFTSLMGKYLPGGWWSFVGKAYFYRQEGLNLPQASVAVLIETILIVTSAIFVSALLLSLSSSVSWVIHTPLGIILGVLCLASIHPLFLNAFLHLAEKMFKRSIISIDYPFQKMAYPFLIFSLFWVGMGTGFWVLAGSVGGIEISLLLQMVSAFALSWIIGFLAFIAPGGLGVREGALMLLLQPHVPSYAAAALALVSRIFWMGGEILALIVSVLWERLSRLEQRTISESGEADLGVQTMPKDKKDIST
jgi:uncharacterized membrane protein YbhN (UPF0104 family)